jgi:dipeptidyl aminopeptidase/acylaminoacyl peptidase
LSRPAQKPHRNHCDAPPETGRAAGEPQEVVATTREDSRGAWSPDGKWIALNSDRSGDMNIWLHSLADGSTRQLTKGPGGDFQPTWSPDGRWIVFFSLRAGNADIWKVEVASSKLVQLTKVPSIDIIRLCRPTGGRSPTSRTREAVGGLAHECRRRRGV